MVWRNPPSISLGQDKHFLSFFFLLRAHCRFARFLCCAHAHACAPARTPHLLHAHLCTFACGILRARAAAAAACAPAAHAHTHFAARCHAVPAACTHTYTHTPFAHHRAFTCPPACHACHAHTAAHHAVPARAYLHTCTHAGFFSFFGLHTPTTHLHTTAFDATLPGSVPAVRARILPCRCLLPHTPATLCAAWDFFSSCLLHRAFYLFPAAHCRAQTPRTACTFASLLGQGRVCAHARAPAGCTHAAAPAAALCLPSCHLPRAPAAMVHGTVGGALLLLPAYACLPACTRATHATAAALLFALYRLPHRPASPLHAPATIRVHYRCRTHFSVPLRLPLIPTLLPAWYTFLVIWTSCTQLHLACCTRLCNTALRLPLYATLLACLPYFSLWLGCAQLPTYQDFCARLSPALTARRLPQRRLPRAMHPTVPRYNAHARLYFLVRKPAARFCYAHSRPRVYFGAVRTLRRFDISRLPWDRTLFTTPAYRAAYLPAVAAAPVARCHAALYTQRTGRFYRARRHYRDISAACLPLPLPSQRAHLCGPLPLLLPWALLLSASGACRAFCRARGFTRNCLTLRCRAATRTPPALPPSCLYRSLLLRRACVNARHAAH